MESLSTVSVPVRIHLTGRMAVTYGENLLSTVDLPGPQVALVIAILATSHQRPTSLIELADIVWNGEPPESWRSTLRGHVSRARSALRDIGIVLSSGDGWYQLELPKGSTVDVIEAEREVHLAEAAARSGDAEAAGRSAVMVAMIAAETVLPELDHPWIDEMRRRMHGYRIRTLEVLIDLWLASGHNEQAAVDAERLVLLDPIRESGYAGLLRAHVAAGNTALALRTYERCRTTLRDELGVSPGDEIEALYESIL